jgi:hypothetical protein
MNYYGYGEQTPSLYVQITAINTLTGSLDAQQQAPFAVDTSQYPFNVAQQNYCNFPGLSEYFKLLPGCGASNSTANTTSSAGNCNTYGLPQFFQPYLPGCQGTGNETGPSSQSSQLLTQQPGSPPASPNALPTPSATPTVSSRSNEAALEIIILASAASLLAALIMKRSTYLGALHNRARPRQQVKFCMECGMRLEAAASFCSRCGEACPGDEETYFFRL